MARSFQGKEFTAEMKQLVINLKLYFDEERKKHKEGYFCPTPRKGKKSLHLEI